jgi:hypothetical protein
MQTIRGTKIEANFRNFVPQHFAEENMPSILFAGTGKFLFDSLSQNAAAKIFQKLCKKKRRLLRYRQIILLSYFGCFVKTNFFRVQIN